MPPADAPRRSEATLLSTPPEANAIANPPGVFGLLRCPSDGGILDVRDDAITCRSCGARYLRTGRYYDLAPTPQDAVSEELLSLYEADYPWDHKAPRWKAAQVLKLLRQTGAGSPAGRPGGPRSWPCVLEAGCGTGEVLRLVGNGLGARRLWLIGVDWAHAALRQAAEPAQWPGDVVLLRGDVQRLPVAEGAVHLLLAIDLLEHLPDPSEFLHEARRVANEIIIKVPISESPDQYTKPTGHMQFLRADDYRRMLHDTDWQVVGERFPLAPGLHDGRSRIGNALRDARSTLVQSVKYLLGARKWYLAHARGDR